MCDTRTHITVQCDQICKYNEQTLVPGHTTQAFDVTTINFAGDTEDGADVFISSGKGSRYSVTS